MKTIVIYDDTGRKSELITDIIGNKGFSDVVVRKKRLEEYYRSEMEKIFPNLVWKKIHSAFGYADLMKELEIDAGAELRILHCFSNYFISDAERAALSFRKLEFVDGNYGVLENNRAVAAMFPGLAGYLNFCKKIVSGRKPWDLVKEMEDSFEIDGVVDLGLFGNFIQCITGNFDSRYFNSLRENEFTLEKSSTNKAKIKAEYTFYHLLPDDMKFWFVMPFHYRENSERASYTMERLHMADLSIKWVHGSMDEAEFEELMDRYFYFFQSRHQRDCTEQEYRDISKVLYEDKVRNRISELKLLPEFKKIQDMLHACGKASIDKLMERYFALKQRIESKTSYPKKLAIGHGDPCFANALYNRSTKTLKFIDPKGAMTEDELWTNPYYDVAKLSHSVCGRYDFFNNALFDVKVNNSLSYDLDIPFDNRKYVEIFKRKVRQNGFDYLSVRIYEVSLFLSMLPLHMDDPHKVFGFILNAENIMEEIEKDV